MSSNLTGRAYDDRDSRFGYPDRLCYSQMLRNRAKLLQRRLEILNDVHRQYVTSEQDA